jgi:hypothetical protein
MCLGDIKKLEIIVKLKENESISSNCKKDNISLFKIGESGIPKVEGKRKFLDTLCSW